MDLPNLYQYQAVLQPLGLEERIVILQEDLKKKEYLFRKPIRYDRVNKVLNQMKQDSEVWLKKCSLASVCRQIDTALHEAKQECRTENTKN